MDKSKRPQTALEYNASRDFPEEVVLEIQRLTRTPRTGRMNQRTVYGSDGIVGWQSHAGLKPDGKIGPKTFRQMGLHLIRRKPTRTHDVIDSTTRKKPAIACGLAIYDQKWPGHTVDEALDTAFISAVAHGAASLWYWSSKHLTKGDAESMWFLSQPETQRDRYQAIWVDESPKVVLTNGWFKRMKSYGFRRISIMLNKAKGRSAWDLRWSKKQLAALRKLAEEYRLDVSLVIWPHPTTAFVEAAHKDITQLIDISGADTVEWDAEGQWASKYRKGYKTMGQAALEVDGLIRGNVHTALTTYTYHWENDGDAALAPLCDFLIPQAYSVRHRTKGKIKWSDSLGPGKHQSLALRRAKEASEATPPRKG